KTLYDYCYYLGGYYALEADEKSIDILKREISRINLKENNYIDYYFKIIKLILSYILKVDKNFSDAKDIPLILDKYIKIIDQFNTKWFYKEHINVPIDEQKMLCIEDFLKLADSLALGDEELASRMD